MILDHQGNVLLFETDRYPLSAIGGGQGYESKSDARDTLEKVMRGEYDGPVEEVE